mmetsp:Transcript_105382/g.250915  ORF Transcript_105382/g.250915 Transcript_105382/m.250915 type:complete len:248 (+) Transcript_105382:4897-5640(+)
MSLAVDAQGKVLVLGAHVPRRPGHQLLLAVEHVVVLRLLPVHEAGNGAGPAVAVLDLRLEALVELGRLSSLGLEDEPSVHIGWQLLAGAQLFPEEGDVPELLALHPNERDILHGVGDDAADVGRDRIWAPDLIGLQVVRHNHVVEDGLGAPGLRLLKGFELLQQGGLKLPFLCLLFVSDPETSLASPALLDPVILDGSIAFLIAAPFILLLQSLLQACDGCVHLLFLPQRSPDVRIIQQGLQLVLSA